MDTKSKLLKGVIYYYSGTGNTLFVTKEYESLFTKNNVSLDTIDIMSVDVVKTQSKYDFLIIAFPVYAWMPPFVVKDFIKRLPIVQDKKACVFATYRASFGGSLRFVTDVLSKKNYDVCCSFGYLLPQNLFLEKKDINDIQKRIDDVKQKIQEDFRKIINNQRSLKKTSKLVVFISKIANNLFSKFFIKNNWAIDYSKCSFCGLCEGLCPVDNIVVKKKKRVVSFSNKCLLCTRCFNFCPNNAIYFKKQKNKFVQYDRFKEYYLK